MTRLEDYPVIVEHTVSWGQMDAFQHVNNVEYFRFFEDARIAYFEAIDIYDNDADEFAGAGPILASTSCRFLRPLTYPDDLEVGARTTEIDDDRFTLEYAVFSVSAERVVAIGDSVVVSYDYGEGRKVELPNSWRTSIAELEETK